MNKVIMMGRLTRDPEIRYSTGENSSAIARFPLAVDRRYKRDGQPDADFFNCTAFGKTAEFVEKYFRKGNKILITGSIQNDNYTNGHGEKVYSVGIIVEEVEFGESKNSEAKPENGSSPAQDSDGFMQVPDGITEELPFA